MSLNCPDCGVPLDAHLSVTLAVDSKGTSATAAAAPRKEPAPAKRPLPLNVNTIDPYLPRLKQLMCFPLSASVPWTPTQATMRPVLCAKEDGVGILKDRRARATLDQVARKMHATIRHAGEQSADALLESRNSSRAEQNLPPLPMYAVIEAVAP